MDKDSKKPNGASAWGSYLPDIIRGHPALPVKGMIVNGRFGKEFHPDSRSGNPKDRKTARLEDWITGRGYDEVLEKTREEAGDAIIELKSAISRLERFIADN